MKKKKKDSFPSSKRQPGQEKSVAESLAGGE